MTSHNFSYVVDVTAANTRHLLRAELLGVPFCVIASGIDSSPIVHPLLGLRKASFPEFHKFVIIFSKNARYGPAIIRC